jgi:ribosomal protein L11 methylase PrmA
LTLDQKLHLAPLRNPQTILDCGTGTGIWAIVRSPLARPQKHAR